jgi:hypothetical protein
MVKNSRRTALLRYHHPGTLLKEVMHTGDNILGGELHHNIYRGGEAVAAEQKESARVEVLEARLENIEAFLLRLDGKLDAWNQNYVPRAELNEMFRARDKEIAEVKLDKRDNKNNGPVWIASCASVISLGVAVVALITN